MEDNYEQNLSTFLRLFKGREDFFAEQGTDSYHPIKKSLNEYYLARHFNFDITIGIYLLTKESFCHLLCFDIDIPKGELENFENHKKFDRLAPNLNKLIEVLVNKFNLKEESLLLEDTGGRGYHIWVFLTKPIPGTMDMSEKVDTKNVLIK